MGKIFKKVDNNFKFIEDNLGNSSDIVKRKIKIKNKLIGYVYLESVSSDDKISDFFMKNINIYINNKNNFLDKLFESLENSIPNSHVSKIENKEDIFYYLASGYTCVFVDKINKALVIETKTKLDRGVVESSSEAIVRGPKDSFTENHSINLGLIRKRIKDKNLWMKDIKIGRRTKTKVTLAYLKDVVDEALVNKIYNNLSEIDIDGILDSGYIRDFLLKGKSSFFPQFINTERPDLASMSILEGKVVILVENSPYVLIIPGLLVDFMHTPEDEYQKPINVTFVRILRLISFLLTIFLPGLYVSLTTFNQEIIPNELLISLAIQREGVPFPTAVETIMMIITFEILRESDIRIPNASGSAIGIVGALVLGEAAVTAGIVSPIVIIIIGITSISGLLFTDIDMVNGIRWWRIIVVLFSSTMGVIGFVSSALLFIIKMASMEYNGVPYLAPLAPLDMNAEEDAIIKVPRFKMKKRPSYLNVKNINRLRDTDEN
jgi:spore germination protein KA